MKFWQILVLACVGMIATYIAIRSTDEPETKRTLVIMLAGQGAAASGAAMGLATNRLRKRKPLSSKPKPAVPGKENP